MCFSDPSATLSWGAEIIQAHASVYQRGIHQRRDPLLLNRLWELHRRAVNHASFQSILEFASTVELPDGGDGEIYDLLESRSTECKEPIADVALPPCTSYDTVRYSAGKGWEHTGIYILPLPPHLATEELSSLTDDEAAGASQDRTSDIDCSFLIQPWHLAFPEQMRRYLDLCDGVIAGNYLAGIEPPNNTPDDSVSSCSSSSSSSSDIDDMPLFPKYPIRADHLSELRRCITKFEELHRRSWETTNGLKSRLYTHGKWHQIRNEGGDITMLMRSGGLASALREGISAEEEWPEQMDWGVPMAKEPREKVYHGGLGKPQIFRKTKCS